MTPHLDSNRVARHRWPNLHRRRDEIFIRSLQDWERPHGDAAGDHHQSTGGSNHPLRPDPPLAAQMRTSTAEDAGTSSAPNTVTSSHWIPRSPATHHRPTPSGCAVSSDTGARLTVLAYRRSCRSSGGPPSRPKTEGQWALGSVTVKVLPLPGPGLSARIWPPCAWTRARAMASPMPVPPWARDLPSPTR